MQKGNISRDSAPGVLFSFSCLVEKPGLIDKLIGNFKWWKGAKLVLQGLSKKYNIYIINSLTSSLVVNKKVEKFLNGYWVNDIIQIKKFDIDLIREFLQDNNCIFFFTDSKNEALMVGEKGIVINDFDGFYK